MLPPTVSLAIGSRLGVYEIVGSLGADIISIFEFRDQDGFAYVVSELVDGETLRARLERGPQTDLLRRGARRSPHLDRRTKMICARVRRFGPLRMMGCVNDSSSWP